MDENSTLSIPENMSTDVVPFYAHFLEVFELFYGFLSFLFSKK